MHRLVVFFLVFAALSLEAAKPLHAQGIGSTLFFSDLLRFPPGTWLNLHLRQLPKDIFDSGFSVGGNPNLSVGHCITLAHARAKSIFNF